MKRFSSGEPDYAFGQAMLNLRTNIGLTQSGLAEQLGVSRRSVGEWEAGNSYPKAKHLKQLIELGIELQAFPAGHEVQAIRDLWAAAHQKVPLDEQWLSALLAHQSPARPLAASPSVETAIIGEQMNSQPGTGTRFDWGDALAVPSFYGREQEMTQLTHWILAERCQIVSLLGMGGIGKSALAVNVMYKLAEHFDIVIFRSLRDAPSCEELLDDCLQVIVPQPLRTVLTSLERRINLLLEHLRTSRILLVLDNLESLLEEGDVQGHLRSDFAGYGRLLRQSAETGHQSCLLLTSREKPAELRPLEGKRSLVRSMRLSGLDTTACKQLFAEKDVVGSPQEQARLIEAYAGNPLALKIVAETITDLFGGAIGQFLDEETVVFGNIADLLAEQFARLSSLEQTVLYWLAIVREPITLDELQAVQISPPPRVQVMEAINGLRQRSLIDLGQRQGSFTLQSVVQEYVITVLIAEATNELQQGKLERLVSHGLEQAHAREYVRQTQERLHVAPILTHLQPTKRGQAAVEEQIFSLLNQVREWADYAQGYGPANLIALLLLLRGHLRELDLSHLVIRGAYLQGIEMQDTKLCGALIRDTVLTEALDAIWAVAVSCTGKFWAAGSRRGEVRLWREGGQRLHLVWQAHTDNTFALAFSPDECTLVTGSWDGTVKLWDVQSGSLLWMRQHTDLVLSVVFSPDGHTLASSGSDAMVHLWDVFSGKHVQTLASQGGAVYSVAWSSDGSLLAGGCFNGSIQVWQMQGSQPAICTKILMGHTNWVHGLAFAPDGTQLASCSWDSTVKLWNVASGHVCQILTGHSKRVYSVAWSLDGCIVASASFDKTIWLWDVAQNRYRAVLHGHTAAVYHLAFIPDSSFLLSGSEDSTIRIWDVDSGRCTRIIQGYAICFYDLDWSPNSMQLVSGSTDGLVIVWDVTGKTPFKLLHAHHWIVYGVAWSPDGQLLASSGWDNTIRLWEPATGNCLQVLQDPDHGDTLFDGVAWNPDGRLLASGSYLRGVHLWDVAARHRCWVRRTNPTAFRRVDWSPDGTCLVSGSDDGSVCLWNTAAGTLQHKLIGHHGKVASVVWSPDGTRLASAGGGRSGGELFVWNVQSGEQERTFAGLADMVSALTWDLSGDRLISGDSDGMLCWWDVQSGECVRRREAHQGIIRSLKRSPDGQQLASCGDDGAIMLCDLDTGEHLQTLRRDRPYERLDITGIRGLTEAQKITLHALGAVEVEGMSS